MLKNQTIDLISLHALVFKASNDDKRNLVRIVKRSEIIQYIK